VRTTILVSLAESHSPLGIKPPSEGGSVNANYNAPGHKLRFP
jgi:hypothetical protein